MEYKYSSRKRMKDKPLMSKRNSVGAELHHLDQDKSITTDPGENNKRRTLRLHKKNQSWGFTLQTYGIKHKKTNEIEIMTYVDYVEINGAAWEAGMRRGDVILSVNGERVGEISHKELVNKIRQGGEVMRLVVLFEDCCRKVDLHEKYIRLKAVLKSKYQELIEIEQEEMKILERYCEGKGLNRFEQIRQSVLSHQSSSNDSWDAYSMISSPNGLLSTGQYAHGQWPSVTSLKSYSVGDNSSTFEEDYSYMDSEAESEDLSSLDDAGNVVKSDSNLIYVRSDSLTVKGDNSAKIRQSRASDSILYKRTKPVSPANQLRTKTISPVSSSECIRDDVFEDERVDTKVPVHDLTLQKDKVFYSGENGNIIVPKICIEGESVYTTFDAIDTNNADNSAEIDVANYQDKIVAIEIAKEMAKFDKLQGQNKLREAGLPDDHIQTTESMGTNPNIEQHVYGSQELKSTNGAKQEVQTKEINGARSKYSKTEVNLVGNQTFSVKSESFSAKRSLPESPKIGRGVVSSIGGSMSYEQLKSSVPDIRTCVSFHTEECQVIYINEKDEATKL